MVVTYLEVGGRLFNLMAAAFTTFQSSDRTRFVYEHMVTSATFIYSCFHGSKFF